MTRFVSLKLTNESDYWLVDLERGVVTRSPGAFAGTAAPGGNTSFDGVDVAIVSEMREDAFSGKYDK